MITIYQRSSCGSSQKAMHWLDNNRISYKKSNIECLSHKQLITILKLTDNGMEDIVKSQGNAKTKSKVKVLNQLKFNDALNYLQFHSEILRTPIIVSHKKLLIGFHSENIRQFIPHNNRML